jgi:WD40 repeat protein
LLSNEKFDIVSFSEDGKLIATHSGKQDNITAKLWRIEGKQLQPLLSKEKFNSVGFSKDGKLIATFPKVSDSKVSETKGSDSKKVNSGSSDDQRVKLWSREGKELASFPSKEHIDYLEFSPDGKLIATTNQKNYTFKLWKLAEQKLQPLQEGKFIKKEFRPDSKLMATANNNNTVQIWNQEGKELAHLNLNNSINSLSFSPDGKILAIVSNDKTAIMWYMKRDDWEKLSRTELKELVKKACGVVGNYLKRKPKDNSDRILCPDIGKK